LLCQRPGFHGHGHAHWGKTGGDPRNPCRSARPKPGASVAGDFSTARMRGGSKAGHRWVRLAPAGFGSRLLRSASACLFGLRLLGSACACSASRHSGEPSRRDQPWSAGRSNARRPFQGQTGAGCYGIGTYQRGPMISSAGLATTCLSGTVRARR
jgi:hypothetical protein